MPPASSNGAFTRRHTAAGAHEFSSPQQPITQHIPAYGVEHLASFAVGKLFGLITPTVFDISLAFISFNIFRMVFESCSRWKETVQFGNFHSFLLNFGF